MVLQFRDLGADASGSGSVRGDRRLGHELADEDVHVLDGHLFLGRTDPHRMKHAGDLSLRHAILDLLRDLLLVGGEVLHAGMTKTGAHRRLRSHQNVLDAGDFGSGTTNCRVFFHLLFCVSDYVGESVLVFNRLASDGTKLHAGDRENDSESHANSGS